MSRLDGFAVFASLLSPMRTYGVCDEESLHGSGLAANGEREGTPQSSPASCVAGWGQGTGKGGRVPWAGAMRGSKVVAGDSPFASVCKRESVCV